ncbi:MAG: SpoIID/LytB domain-containing protein [Chlamydiales bacterium]|nr:SpoIID/LytB domain-containing protein [Chlamydiales bacterium]
MIARIFSLLLAMLAVAPALQAGPWENFSNFFSKKTYPAPPMLRILIVDRRPEVNVEVKGRYKIFDPRNNSHIATRKLGKRDQMAAESDGIRWGEQFPGVYQLLIVPEDMSIPVIVDGIEYRGAIYVYNIEGTLSVVNRADMEHYLTSVLTPVFDDTAPQELLAAAAITARTNAYFMAENPKNPFWAVNASQVDYMGYVPVNADAAINRAINETRYMIMSKTGTYEGMVTPFPVVWEGIGDKVGSTGVGVKSKISFSEAETMAKKGDNAAQILQAAFPQTTIQMIYSAPGTH